MAFSAYARKFYETNLSIIPIKGKAPELQSWQKYCQASADESTFTYWEDAFKEYNIGLCLGPASNIVAFDFDYEGSDKQVIENIIFGMLPPSPVRKVGKKGWTAFYKFSNQQNMSVNRGNKRVFDFLSTGKQTVIPPSIHPSGIPYKWMTQFTLLDIEANDLPELDEAILLQLKNVLQSSTEELFEEKIIAAIPRHDLCVGYIFKMLSLLSDNTEIIAAVLKYDKDNALGGRYEGKPAYFEDPKYLSGKETPEQAASKLVNRIIKWAKAKSATSGHQFKLGAKAESATSKTGFHFVVEKVDKRTGEVRIIRKPDFYGFAQWCSTQLNAICDEAGTFYIYNDGKYEHLSDLMIEHLVIQKTEFTVKPQDINNFVKILKGTNFKRIKESPDGFLNLKNGILDVNSNKLLAHSPDYHFFYKLDVEYNKDAKSPHWDKFLLQIFEGNKELADTINKIFAYCLQGGYPYLHKAFVFYGSGRNGKSTVISVLRNLLGRDNVSNIPLHSLDNPFSVINLQNKLLNYNEEMTEDDLKSTDFKDVVSGGFVRASKKFKDEINFQVKARFVFATNHFPKFNDSSTGLDRRLLIIPFNYLITDEEIDLTLSEKLKIELSGILNTALSFLTELELTKNISEPKATNEIKEEYKEESDSVYAWLIENIEYQKNRELTVNAAFDDYLLWCAKQDRRSVGKTSFGRRVLLAISKNDSLKHKKIERLRSKQSRYFLGIKLSNNV